jgi:hypothetical protein
MATVTHGTATIVKAGPEGIEIRACTSVRAVTMSFAI